jgi:hypothetical protein
VLILGLPEAAALLPEIEESAIDYDAMGAVFLDGVFGDEGPINSLGVSTEDGLEGGADGGLVLDVEALVLAEDGVVVLDDLVSGGC